MMTIGAFEAEAKFAGLLDRVGEGEVELITHRGEAAALLVPPDRLGRD